MAEAARLEITTRDAILAVGFVAITLAVITLSMTGVITSPLTLGILMTETIVLLFVGHGLVRARVISKQALPLWYTLSLGIVLLTYGGIQAGWIPVAFVYRASLVEVAITNAMFYTILVLSVAAAAAAVYAAYQYYRTRYMAYAR